MEKTNLHGLSKKKNYPIVILLNSDLIIQKINTTGEVFFNKNKRALINHSFIDLLHKINIDTLEFSLALQSNNSNFYQYITFKHTVSNKTYNAIVVTVGQLKEKTYILNIYLSDNYQAYLHGIINNLPGAVYWKDKEGRYLGCNTFVAKMAGYDNPEKLIGKTDYDLCWNEFAEEWQSLDNKVIQENTTIVREEKAKLSNGKIITELTFKTPLKNEQGEIVGIIGTSLDITERKKMEEELNTAKLAAINLNEQTSSTLGNIVANMPGHVYWKDTHGVYLGCNLRQAISLGCKDPKEVIGKTDFDLPWDKNVAESYKKNDLRIMQSQVAEIIEEESQMDGQKRIVLSHKTPMIDRKGEVTGILGISIDITDRKKMEDELNSAKLAAESANLLKTNFIQNMQHDIRTPASSVWSTLNQLVENNQIPDKELLTMLRDSSKQLFSICNDVIDFDRTENGERSVLSKRFDVRQVIQNVIELNKIAARERGLKLSFFVDDKIPHAMKGDEHRISRIFINLMGNALKFTTHGSISLSAQLAEEKEKTYIIRFELQDTGIGIPLEKQETLYEKFNRLNPANRNTYTGSGLGLRIVKKYVDDLEGEINVKSELNKGTTFFIDIPFEKTLTQAELISSPPVEEKQTNPVTLSDHPPSFPTAPKFALGETPLLSPSSSSISAEILLIEDDALTTKAGKMLLENQHCKVTTAANVKSALETLHRISFDLVISDIGLPDGTGFDVLTTIKKDNDSLNFPTPFVALTANADTETIEKGKKLGFEEVIAKPLQENKIKTLLQSLVNKKISVTSSASTLLSSVDESIIDFEETKKLSNNRADKALYMLQQLANSLPYEQIQLQDAYELCSRSAMRSHLFRFEGGLRYVCCPKLHQAILKLQKSIEIEPFDSIKSIEDLLQEVYKEITHFLTTHQQVKQFSPAFIEEKPSDLRPYIGRYETLLVEDDILTAEATRMCLEASNCEVTVAPDISTAMDWLEREKFDLVVSDIGLPDGTGIDLIQTIKKDKQSINFSTPLFALTAHTDKAIQEKAKQAGFMVVLTKPLISTTLEALIDKFLYSKKKEEHDLHASGQLHYTLSSKLEKYLSYEQGKKLLCYNAPQAIKMMDLLTKSLKKDLTLLKKAYKQQNFDKICTIVSRFEGGLRDMGVPVLHEATLTLLDKAKIAKTVDDIYGSFNNLCSEIEGFLIAYKDFKEPHSQIDKVSGSKKRNQA